MKWIVEVINDIKNKFCSISTKQDMFSRFDSFLSKWPISCAILAALSVIILTNNRKWLAHTVHRLRSTDFSCTSKHPGLSNVRDWYIVFIAWAWWTGDFNTVHIKLVCHKLSLSASCSGNFYCAGQDHRYASRNSCIRRVHCQCRLSDWNRHNTQYSTVNNSL